MEIREKRWERNTMTKTLWIYALNHIFLQREPWGTYLWYAAPTEIS